MCCQAGAAPGTIATRAEGPHAAVACCPGVPGLAMQQAHCGRESNVTKHPPRRLISRVFCVLTQLADPGLPCSLQVPGPRDRAYRQRMRPRSLTPSDPSGRWRQHSGVVAPVYHGNSVRHVGTNPAPCMAGTSTGISAWQQRPPLLFNHMCIQ